MAASSTYTPIATTTLGSTTSSYTFSSIPSTYTDLFLVISALYNGTDGYAIMQFNGDVISGFYSATVLSGNGTAAGSNRFTSINQIYLMNSGRGNTTSPTIYNVNFQNYSNTTTYKTSLVRGSNFQSTETSASVGLWRNTSAINSITLSAPSSNFSAGTTLTLYGIAAA